MQQFFQNQMQLLQNLTDTVANLQAQANNPPPPLPQQPAPMNRHREFMSHRPPVFTHAADPLDADDWLKTVSKMLTMAQCDDREKVLFAAGRLQGNFCTLEYRSTENCLIHAHANPFDFHSTIVWNNYMQKIKCTQSYI
jgi:hypothetical protein